MPRPNLHQKELDSHLCGLPKHITDIQELVMYIIEQEKQIRALENNQCQCKRLPA